MKPATAHKPPVTTTLRWCPECGRSGEWLAGTYGHADECHGTAETITYDRRVAEKGQHA